MIRWAVWILREHFASPRNRRFRLPKVPDAAAVRARNLLVGSNSIAFVFEDSLILVIMIKQISYEVRVHNFPILSPGVFLFPFGLEYVQTLFDSPRVL